MAQSGSYLEKKEENIDSLYKIVLVGDAETGKTQLLNIYTRQEFDRGYKATVGVDFAVRTVEINETDIIEERTTGKKTQEPKGAEKLKKIKLQIWDTAGQERYQTVIGSYFKGAQAYIITYDITTAETFDRAKQVLENIRREGEKNALIFLVGTKLDLVEDKTRPRAVSTQDAHEFARENGIEFGAETSVNNQQDIDDLFSKLTKQIYLHQNQKKITKQVMKQALARENLQDDLIPAPRPTPFNWRKHASKVAVGVVAAVAVITLVTLGIVFWPLLAAMATAALVSLALKVAGGCLLSLFVTWAIAEKAAQTCCLPPREARKLESGSTLRTQSVLIGDGKEPLYESVTGPGQGELPFAASLDHRIASEETNKFDVPAPTSGSDSPRAGM